MGPQVHIIRIQHAFFTLQQEEEVMEVSEREMKCECHKKDTNRTRLTEKENARARNEMIIVNFIMG